jgi:hypothetical protein
VLVASLALLAPAPVTPDLPSLSLPSALPLVDVLVQGAGAAAAVAAVGGASLAALPIVDGLLARVPAAGADRLPDHPGVRAVTDADRRLHVRAAEPTPGVRTARSNPRPVPLASPSGGPRSRGRG